jgi:hypothetical protein
MPNRYPEYYPPKEKMLRIGIWQKNGDLSQSEKLFEIKPPLAGNFLLTSIVKRALNANLQYSANFLFMCCVCLLISNNTFKVLVRLRVADYANFLQCTLANNSAGSKTKVV